MPTETEFLSAYLPASLLRGLAENPAAFGRPHCELRPGALLFADIVGFTALASEYGSRGQDGVEELTALLDACFGRLVESVLAHGGDVLRFPGDAVLAFWEAASADGLPDCVHRAAQCALALQECFTADGAHTANRRLRIALSSGYVKIAHAGGADGRWEFLAMGEPFAALGAAVEHARPGEVVLTPSAERAVRQRVHGERRGEFLCLDRLLGTIESPTHTAPTLPGEITPALRAFVPRPVLARLDAGQLDWMAEFRRISVLFLELAGIGADATEEIDSLQTAMHATQVVLYQFGGGVNQVVVDDKGLNVVAVWGCGLHTHEDDAARAVLAAMALHERLGTLVPATAIGVATGRAFCGRRGSAERAEYAVIGNAVNLAARLMKAAGSGVLCDHETFAAANSRIDFEPGEPIRVKGRSDPVEVYRARGARRSHARTDGSMVGREAERQLLRARVDTLADAGQGGVVVIEGDAGIGKSRLVADLLEHVRSRRIRPPEGESGTDAP